MGNEPAEETPEKRNSNDDAVHTSQPMDGHSSREEQFSGGVGQSVAPSGTGTAVSGTSVQRAATEGDGLRVTAGDSYTTYDPGPDHQELSARYGLDFCRRGQVQRVQRLESEFGQDRVARWADEGMTVDTMGKPRDMEAFRKRQAERSEEIPADIERQNQASWQRNVHRSTDKRGSEEVGSAVEHLHTGPAADEAARSINAEAFTMGNNTAFAKGKHDPDSRSGKELLAHELTHVAQQSQGVARQTAPDIQDKRPNDEDELSEEVMYCGAGR